MVEKHVYERDGAQNAGDQIDEQLNQINSRVEAEFEKSQVPHLMKSVKATSRAELEASLKSYGSSLKGQQQLFREQVMGMQMRQRYVTNNPEISLEQLLGRYQENIKELFLITKETNCHDNCSCNRIVCSEMVKLKH